MKRNKPLFQSLVFRLVFLTISLWVVKANATNYYLSNTGNDTNSGTSSAAPWQTITRLNLTNYLPGDTIFFKCGDTFRGDIRVNRGGNALSNLVFTSWGTGNKPIISGAELVTGWTLSGGYYHAPYIGNVVNFFVNGAEQMIARFPNEHSYLTLDSGQTMYLKDASLSSISTSYITNSKVCVHSSQWSWEKANITSYAANKINFSSAMIKAIPNYGYFLYDNITLLDTAYEWKYDSTAHIVHYLPPSVITPSLSICEASVYQNGMELTDTVGYVIIKGLAFSMQSDCGIKTNGANNKRLIIDNCYFSGQYNYGINMKGAHCHISNCYFRDIDGIGLFINNTGANADTVNNNTFRNVGVSRANGIGGQLNGTALMCASDSNHIHHNNIDSTGYCGISADGRANIVERNIVDHAMLIEIDGGAIKGWGSGTAYSIYRNNFISNSDGNPEGAFRPSFVTPAIYFDFNVNNCTIADNTVYNHVKKGIFQNSSNINNTITGNVIYGSRYMLDLNGTNLATGYVPISGMTIKHNSFFCRDTGDIIIRQVDYSGGFHAGTLDSNYYFQPYTDRYALRLVDTTPTYYTFSGWQATGNDTYTDSSFVSWTYPVDSSQLFMNQADTIAYISLGTAQYYDLGMNNICNTLTLQPYTSKILIKTPYTCLTTNTIQLAEAKNAEIYPNPTNGDITIKTPQNILPANYCIYDITGRKIADGLLNKTTESIMTSFYEPGIYIIQVAGVQQLRMKFIKE